MSAKRSTAGRDLRERLARIAWPEVAEQLEALGHARIPRLLDARQCAEVAMLWEEPRRFRSRIDLERHRFGRGEYKYFARPLPVMVGLLRTALYPPLARIADAWNAELGAPERFPGSHRRFLERCHAAGQERPTPLLLHYTAGGYNRLHQDLYGSVAFPLQVACLLSRPERDFRGGEFLLVEQRPRMQSQGEAIALSQGEAVVFPTRNRPVAGTRGVYRAGMRHGVSRIHSGRRLTLGIIFHDAR